MAKEKNKTVRRLVDYRDMKQYKTMQTIAKNKGLTLKIFVQNLFTTLETRHDQKQLDLFTKNDQKK